jgi:hypothetical protein
MNQLETKQKTKQIENAKSGVANVRRELQEKLIAYGWNPTAANEPLTNFDTYLSLLENTSQAIRELKPVPGKDHEKELSALISKEAYFLESLDSLARAAREGLKAEKLAFFAAREEIQKPAKDEIQEADEALQNAVEIFAGAMQKKWRAMLQLRDVNLVLYEISNEHGTSPQLAEPELRLNKPFDKSRVTAFPSFVEKIMARLTAIIGGAENWRPEDVVRGVFEK